MKRLSLVGLSLALAFAMATAWAQESRAVLSGTVTDPQGAVVPAASVEVKNLQTNVISKATTNDRGLYTSPPLGPSPCPLSQEERQAHLPIDRERTNERTGDYSPSSVTPVSRRPFLTSYCSGLPFTS